MVVIAAKGVVVAVIARARTMRKAEKKKQKYIVVIVHKDNLERGCQVHALYP